MGKKLYGGNHAGAGHLHPANNTALGFRVWHNRINGISWTILIRLTTGYWNTVNGTVAFENATTAAGNTAIGVSSFRTNVTGFENVGVGINTGYHVTSGANTYIGSFAGEGAAGFSTGGSNTATGYFALSDIRSGFSNTAVGRMP
ncbi:MAG: hypothetical protein IPL50_17940 [Chitinophagaceae bacterium]|nr:hypothetical protein [Chitinophagaceae bacterium]